jgi:hypothetical protein
MDHAMLLLRLFHVVLGVYWAGTVIFTALYLEPSVRAAGPAGGQVMTQLIRRGHLNVLPGVGLITILTGLDLYRRVSGGFQMGWITSRQGVALTIGASTAVVALVIGAFVMRPTALRIVALSESAQQVPEGPERESKLTEIQPLRRRAMVSIRWLAVLLLVTVATMAVAQYL